ncbi:MAG: DUF5681 domain-containing protein [Parasphingorhabdus sp.]
MAGKDSDQGAGGYSNPPKDSQFSSGSSGNPNGRRQGAKNRTTILREIANEEHRITISDGSTQVKIIDLLFMRLRELAMKGDEKALDAYTDWLDRFEAEKENTWSVGLRLGERFYGSSGSPLRVEKAGKPSHG